MKIKRVMVDGVEIKDPIASFSQGQGFVDLFILDEDGKPTISDGIPVTKRLTGVVFVEWEATIFPDD